MTPLTPNGASAAAFVPPLAEHSRFVARVRRRYADVLPLLVPGVPRKAQMQLGLSALQATGLDLPSALRVLRHLVLERLAVLDCEHSATLNDITYPMTELAELALDQAHQLALSALTELHGTPMAGDVAAQCWIMGMGKLGARELNVSSDIDLIYVYDQDGETSGNAQGRQRISNHEFFGKLVKHIYQTVGESTEHGLVFRVDLALRPNGNSGPAAVSLSALENYFVVQGREWERFAWLKSRVVAPLSAVHDTSVSALRSVVLPFVFRRYLDYNVFESLRQLHHQIRDHAAKRAAGNAGRANDVKLSRGGIREIEFTVQLLQVVRGGQFPELRRRPTLDALPRLATAKLMSDQTAQALADAYVFLRQVEHRIQYLDDQQTHLIPTQDADLLWVAQTMGFPQVGSFLQTLHAHRETVAQEFDTLLGGETPAHCPGGPCAGKAPKGAAIEDFATLSEALPPALGEKVLAWSTQARVGALREEARSRVFRLIQRTGSWIEEGRVTEVGALRWIDWVDSMLRRDSYLALLQERPSVHERLLRLLGAAKWPARYLLQHPGVIDELAGQALLQDRFNAAQFESELEARRRSLQSTGEDDDETLLNLLRRAHHAEVFSTLARDVEGVLSIEQVADDLSALADSVLRVTAQWCWSRLKNRHREQPRIAIIGYGKLGGKELGYGSDLDIVFVYDDEDDNASDIYSAFVRKLINWLTVKTGEGDLFEIDTALRPNGNAGMLVSHFTSFANYQERRGSNTAWTWEHQAMTRARCVLDPTAQTEANPLGARFEAVRETVITAERDGAALAQEIRAMRDKVRQAHPTRAGMFDVKHSVGGMVDIEFAVQHLILSQAKDHPSLRPNLGNTALLLNAEAAGLLPAGMGLSASNAYRALRHLQHHARLDETRPEVAPSVMAPHIAAVQALWQHVLGTGAPPQA